MSPSSRGLLPLVVVLLLAPACAHAPPPARPHPAPPRTFEVVGLPAMGVVEAPVSSPAELRARLRAVLGIAHAEAWRLAGPPMLVVPPAGPRRLALPVAGRPALRPPFSFTLRRPTKAAVETVHGTLPEAEAKARALRRRLSRAGLAPRGPLLLELVDDPGATAPSRRRTRIVIPLGS